MLAGHGGGMVLVSALTGKQYSAKLAVCDELRGGCAMSTESLNPGGENPSATLLRDLLSLEPATDPGPLYRLTLLESELLALWGRECREIRQRMIAEGFLDEK
jgi:hypothetical protein